MQSQPAASGAPTSIVHTGATSTASDGKESETAKNTERWSRKEEEEKNEIARREAARVKLKVLEERIKEREQQQRDNESRNRSSQRERLDSENSDSSKGGSQRSKSSRDMPPRFLKQQSQSKGSRKDENAPPSPSPFDGTVLSVVFSLLMFGSLIGILNDLCRVDTRSTWKFLLSLTFATSRRRRGDYLDLTLVSFLN